MTLLTCEEQNQRARARAVGARAERYEREWINARYHLGGMVLTGPVWHKPPAAAKRRMPSPKLDSLVELQRELLDAGELRFVEPNPFAR